MSVLLRIRVDAPAYEKFLRFLEFKQVKVIAICHEKPSNENPHYHMYAEMTGSLDALKRSRSRYFHDDVTMKGNGVASIQIMDQESEYKEYMCKGETVVKDPKTKIYYGKCNPCILLNLYNWNVNELHESFWNRHKNDKVKTKMNFTPKLLQDWEKYNLSPSEEVFDSFDDIDQSSVSVTVPVQLDIETHIVDWLIDYLGMENKPWDKYIVIRYMNLILFKYKKHFNTRSNKLAMYKVKYDILHSLGMSCNRLSGDEDYWVEKNLDI